VCLIHIVHLDPGAVCLLLVGGFGISADWAFPVVRKVLKRYPVAISVGIVDVIAHGALENIIRSHITLKQIFTERRS